MAGELLSSRVLLVEGVDDKHVVRHLCGHWQNMPEFDICDKKGFPKLARAIGPELKVSGRRAVGILADANDDLNARWQAIAGRLRQAGINPPTDMTPAGIVIEGRPRIGIWLMPNNESAGELEDFAAKLIPEDDLVWPMATRYIDDIPIAARKFTASKILRAKIHAWLATRAEPRKMGAAIGIGELDATVPLAVTFTDWLRSLFC